MAAPITYDHKPVRDVSRLTTYWQITDDGRTCGSDGRRSQSHGPNSLAYVVAVATAVQEMFASVARDDSAHSKDPIDTAGHGTRERLYHRLLPAGTDGESARGWGVKDGGILIYEEGAFIADAVFDSTLPIREDGGRILLITTPGRKGGFAHSLWMGNDEVEKITARSTDTERMTEKVAFDRKYMPPLQFAVEHELRWVGGGVPFFAPETIENAFTDTPELRIGNIYATV